MATKSLNQRIGEVPSIEKDKEKRRPPPHSRYSNEMASTMEIRPPIFMYSYVSAKQNKNSQKVRAVCVCVCVCVRERERERERRSFGHGPLSALVKLRH